LLVFLIIIIWYLYFDWHECMYYIPYKQDIWWCIFTSMYLSFSSFIRMTMFIVYKISEKMADFAQCPDEREFVILYSLVNVVMVCNRLEYNKILRCSGLLFISNTKINLCQRFVYHTRYYNHNIVYNILWLLKSIPTYYLKRCE
jgi:hypothetical protein